MAAPYPAPETPRLRVTEIFHSLQGEGLSTGERTGFIRLTGCPLRCVYCDTTYAFKGGQRLSLDAILAEVARFHVRYVCVTGGEPLAQRGCLNLLARLCDAGYEVSLETAGALDISEVDPRVIKVMDLKTPASGELSRNLYANLDYLGQSDQLKFVICSEDDYRWAADLVVTRDLPSRCTVLFSPAASQLAPRDLADWILRDRLSVRLQIQLHKLLWGDEPGR
jgi:7-carboxy-7-deazaguanine synthase